MILKKIIDWNERKIETYYRGARTVRFFDHMQAASKDRVFKEIRKLSEDGYLPARLPDQPRVWVYTRGAAA